MGPPKMWEVAFHEEDNETVCALVCLVLGIKMVKEERREVSHVRFVCVQSAALVCCVCCCLSDPKSETKGSEEEE